MAENPGCEESDKEDSVFYAFFSCLCKGIKFYELKDVGLNYWHHVTLEREPNNPYDCNAVVAHAISSEGKPLMLVHVEKQAAEWLSFLLSCPFCIYG